MPEKAPWITYRPHLKDLDCTIRDGGLMNNHKFDDQVVKAVYTACVEAGVDYMELGYKSGKKVFSRDRFGAWRHWWSFRAAHRRRSAEDQRAGRRAAFHGHGTVKDGRHPLGQHRGGRA